MELEKEDEKCMTKGQNLTMWILVISLLITSFCLIIDGHRINVLEQKVETLEGLFTYINGRKI